jgi:hypothetical protein
MVPHFPGKMATMEFVDMASLYIYVVDRDLGFAPNPFHGSCTLATCKPVIRNGAKVGDWVMGVGGGRLKATGKCIYLMRVSETLTFNEYWSDARFQRKKPLRNGSLVMMVGDNIYHQEADGSWVQEDSHHSNPDGSPNVENVQRDTSCMNVLISNHFFYFGGSAPVVDLSLIGYENHVGQSKKPLSCPATLGFIEKFEEEHRHVLNTVIGDPCNFASARKRVNQATGKML